MMNPERAVKAIGILASLALNGACSGSERTDQEPTLASYSAVEEMRVSSNEQPGHELTTVGTLLEGRQGEIVVSQPAEGLIRVFGSDGRFLRVIGRKGQGPGEFVELTGLTRRGDTIFAADDRLRRGTAFSMMGRVLLTAQVPQQSRPSVPAMHYALTSFNGTHFILRGLDIGPPVSAGVEREAPVVAADVATNSWREMFPINPGHFRSQVTVGGRSIMTGQPIPDGDLLAVGNVDPDKACKIQRAFFEEETRGDYTLQCFDWSGRLLVEQSFRHAPVAVPSPVRDSIIQKAVRDIEELGVSRSAASAAVARSLFVPSRYPPVRTALVSADGEIWVRIRQPNTGDHEEWHVIDATGRRYAHVELPVGVRLRFVNRTRLLGVITDSLGVQTVVRLRLSPSKR